MNRWLGQAIAISVLAVLAALSISLFLRPGPIYAQSPPPLPHDTSGRERCLVCHAASGANAVPPGHSAFDEATCLGCHSSAAVPAAPSETVNVTPPAGQAPAGGACPDCHGQPGLTMETAGGDTVPLFVDAQELAGSVHGGKLLCGDCHRSVTGYPHPALEASTAREYSISQYEACKQCHFDNYTKTLDSVHYARLTEGDTGTPLCTDCHGAHDVAPPAVPRSKISQTCSTCHQDVYLDYAGSVHGKALVTENGRDVPVCTDCHLSHTIEDPRTASFRIESVNLCSKCHGDQELMERYGISTDVTKTYLQDFHGASIALLAKQHAESWPAEAVCTDCHGVHDIRSADDPGSTVMQANLVNTCRNCHDDATANFPGAWLSHYVPSPDNAQIVFYVRLFYRVLIPFILVGLLVHISLDVWRVVTNR